MNYKLQKKEYVKVSISCCKDRIKNIRKEIKRLEKLEKKYQMIIRNKRRQIR